MIDYNLLNAAILVLIAVGVLHIVGYLYGLIVGLVALIKTIQKMEEM